LSYFNKNKSKIIVGLGALIVGLAFGRYAAPEKTKVVVEEIEIEKIIEVEKKIYIKEEVKKTASKTNTRTKKVTKPDGTIIEEKVESQEDVTFADTTQKEGSENTSLKESVSTNKTEKIVNYDKKKFKVSLLMSTNYEESALSVPDLNYGVHATYNFFGPVSVGVFGLTSKEAGLSLGIEF